MQPTNRITYRFDRKGNKINEIEAVEQHVIGESLPQITQNVQDVDHMEQSSVAKEEVTQRDELYGIDLERLEQLIRDSNPHKISHAVETDQEQTYKSHTYKPSYYNQEAIQEEESIIAKDEHAFELIQPEHHLEQNNEQAYPWSHFSVEQHSEQALPPVIDEKEHLAKQERRLTWAASFITVLSAVMTGMLLGYLLLVQVFGSVWWQSDAMAASSNTITETDDLVPTAPVGQEELVAATTIDTSEEHYSYQLLQTGVFSQEKTRDETIAALRNAGYAAQYTKASNGKYYVYTALTTSAINSEPYKAAVTGFELYRKELLLQLPQALQYNGDSELLNNYFTQSNALIAMYADLVAAQLEQPTFSKIGSSSEEAWQQKYTMWASLSAEVMDGFSNTDGQQYAVDMQNALKNAQNHMLEYQKKPSPKHIWSVQASIVEAVLLQKEWFEQLS